MKHLALLFLSASVAWGQLPDAPVPVVAAAAAALAPSTVITTTATTQPIKHPFRLTLDRTDKLLLLSDLTVRSLDAWTTNRALGREAGGGRRFVEAGWPARLFAEGHPAAVWAYSEAVPVGYAVLTGWMNRRRHGRLAKVVWAAELAQDSWAVGGNLEQGRGSAGPVAGPGKGRY
jgi:hypothetical protein